MIFSFTFLRLQTTKPFFFFYQRTRILVVFLLLMLTQSISSQIFYTSVNNHTGNWETPTTWLPKWNSPATIIANINVTIYGYVTCNGSLTFTGNDDYLTIYDTLVIYGNLTIKNNSKLILKENSVLIVKGNLTLGNYGDVYSHSYLIVTGDFIKEGSLINGNFHTDTPSDVFIGGNVQSGLDHTRYPVFNCPGPYQYKGCNYGNMEDLAISPIFPFFQTTCAPVTITSSSNPMCQNESRTLTGNPAGGTFSIVTGPGTNNANVLTATGAGTIVIKYTESGICHNSGTQNITINALPDPIINITDNSGTTINDGVICNGQTATLKATGGISYIWSSGEISPEIIKSSPGIYTVTATDGNNCKNASSKTITVNTLPVAVISISETSALLPNDGIICNGASTILTATGGITYTWSSGETSSEIIKNTAGTYTVTATDENNCQNTSSKTIIVNPNPTINISLTETSGKIPNDGIICNGAIATLTATGGVSYVWSSGETSPEIIKSAGSFTVTATDENNCQNTAGSTITVNSSPAVAISIADTSGTLLNDGIICSGAATTLTATGGISYSWSSGETSPEIAKSNAGLYKVIATDENNCQNTASSTITVNSLPEVAISLAETSGILANDGIICNGAATTLTATGGIIYSWSSGETSPEIVKSNAGSYTVIATDANNCQNTSSKTITVKPLPIADISISETFGVSNNDGLICEGESAILSVTSGNSILWSTGEKDAEIQVNKSGSYSVTITDNNQCSTTSNTLIKTTETISKAGTDTDVCGKQYSLEAVASPGTGTWTVREGAGALTFSSNANDPLSTIRISDYGNYRLSWTVINENCTASSDVNITFHEPPIANAGLDQSLNYAFTTKLNAELIPDYNGQWSVISGSGNIQNSNSPLTEISNLSPGDNRLLWTVSSDKCSDTDTLSIAVNDLFIPNVITPDGDNKNNFFVIKDIEKNSPVELIIFNRWGKEVYKNNSYNNTWDGRSDNNDELPDDTYFYVLKLASGKMIKSFVVIKR